MGYFDIFGNLLVFFLTWLLKTVSLPFSYLSIHGATANNRLTELSIKTGSNRRDPA